MQTLHYLAKADRLTASAPTCALWRCDNEDNNCWASAHRFVVKYLIIVTSSTASSQRLPAAGITSVPLAEWICRRQVASADAGTRGQSVSRYRSCTRSATIRSLPRPSGRSSKWQSGATPGRRRARPRSVSAHPSGSWGRERNRLWPGEWWRLNRTRPQAAWMS